MSTYVLLHGGGAGAWIWKYTEALLRQRGHEVLAVTFTGFAERRHLMSPQSTIELHVIDVLNAIEFHDVQDAVLVAHSYSGTVAPGVLAAAGSRFRSVIFLDSVLLLQGEAIAPALGFMPAEQAAMVLAGVRSGAIAPHAPIAEQQRAEAAAHPFRMSAERQQWMLGHLSDMPLIGNVAPVAVGAESVSIKASYIAVSDTVMKPVMHDKARKLGWTVEDVDGDHAILVGDPETTVRLLEKLA